jgi:hypothetical protein
VLCPECRKHSMRIGEQECDKCHQLSPLIRAVKKAVRFSRRALRVSRREQR